MASDIQLPPNRDAGQNKGGNHVSSTSIPIIDLSPFTNPEGPATARRRQTAASLVEALRHTGFAYIINHGISASTLSDAFALSKAFFALPMETKKLAPHPPGWQVHRGYSWPGLEKVSNELAPGSPTAVQSRAEPPGVRDAQAFLRQVPDLKESFDMGSPDNTHQPNIFLPLSAEATLLPPGWRPSMLSLYSAFWDLGRALLRAIAVGLRLPDEDTLVRPCAGGRYNQLRLLHYPSVEASRLETGRAARMPAHSDWSVVTLLFQDGCGGLQVEGTRAGEFVDVEPVEGAAVVNVGDLLMRWSNDHLRSTQHRVALPPQQDCFTGAERLTQERFSIPYFITTAPDALIEPLCVDAARPARYEPITQRDYGAMRARMQY